MYLLLNKSCYVADAPFVEVNKTAATVVEGESITLYCNATGKPNPTLTWTKDGSLGALSYNAILNTGILNRNDTINNTIQYQCAASNGVESPATAVANVTVLCKFYVLFNLMIVYIEVFNMGTYYSCDMSL